MLCSKKCPAKDDHPEFGLYFIFKIDNSVYCCALALAARRGGLGVGQWYYGTLVLTQINKARPSDGALISGSGQQNFWTSLRHYTYIRLSLVSLFRENKKTG